MINELDAGPAIVRRRTIPADDAAPKSRRVNFTEDAAFVRAFDAFWQANGLAVSRSDALARAVRFWMQHATADR